MKNVVFFVILAILTVAALVGFNIFKEKLPPSLTRRFAPAATGTIRPTPTGGPEGTALRNFGGANYPGGPTTGPLPTGYQGAVTKGGLPVSSVTPVPTVKASMTPYPTTQPTSSPQYNQSTVSYTDAGFSPSSLTVKAGTMVTFRNDSYRSMKVTGDDNAKKTYGSFDQSMTVGNGGLFQYQFTTAGTFGYRDANNGSYTGTIVVAQ